MQKILPRDDSFPTYIFTWFRFLISANLFLPSNELRSMK